MLLKKLTSVSLSKSSRPSFKNCSDVRLSINGNVIFVLVEKKDNELLEERRMNRGKKKVPWGKSSFKGKVKQRKKTTFRKILCMEVSVNLKISQLI